MTMIRYIHIAFEIWGAIFCIIAAICAYASKVRERNATRAMLMILMVDCVINISDALAYYYRGDETGLGFVMVRVSNFMVFVGGILLVPAAYAYITRIINNRLGSRERWPDKYIYGLCAFALIMLVLSNIFGIYYAFDAHNRYYRLDMYWISVALNELELLVLVYVTMRYRSCFRRLEFIAIMTLEFLPVVAMILQLFFYGISLFNIADTISIIFLVVVHELEYSREMVRRERLIASERIRLYNSQIQPHFLYNTLGAIKSTYYDDPELARGAIDQFTDFLRHNMDSLTDDQPISFEKELAHVRCYLDLLQLRFGDSLHVEYDLECTDFRIPTLTLQPLVENAVSYGVRKNPKGNGLVIIRTRELPENYEVSVIDNGPGFVPDNVPGDSERSHIGIQNVRSRLHSAIGAELTIRSEPGKGTAAVMILPKGKENA